MFLLSDDEATNVFLITADGADWKRLNLSADGLCGRVARLRAALSPGDSLTCAGAPAVSQGATLGQPGARGMVGSRPVVAYDRAAAYALWRDLFQPFAGQLRGRSRLIVATAGPLIDLPLGALVVRRPVGRDDDPAALRQTEWLVRSLAVSLLPEPGLLPLLRQPGPVRSSVGFVGVGAPCRSSCRGPGEPPAVAALDDSLAHLPPLPGSESELKAMAAAAKGPATLLVGADATEQKVLSGALSHHDVIAFATHGLRQDEFGAPEPSLVLSLDPAAPENPGLLSASIIARDLKVDASWVILSACDTAAPDARSHDAAFSGLSRAFFAAGARSVLVSYAAVDDDIAQRLTVPTVSSSLAHAEALRRAEMSVLVDSSRPSFAEPKTWAMFALVGDGD
jgi:CHAT domain-containing protein